MKRFTFFLVDILLTINCLCQNLYPVGAINTSMANTTSANQGVWSLFGNQAALAITSPKSAFCSYRNNYFVKELSVKAFGVTAPFLSTQFGLCFQQFGYSLYNEKKMGFSVAKKLTDNLYLGIQIDYFRINIPEADNNSNYFTAEAGLMARMGARTWFSSHVFNPFIKKNNEIYRESMPTIFKAGVNHLLSASFRFVAEAEKELERELIGKLAAEYTIKNLIALRAGISTHSVLNSFGVGILFKSWNVDVAFQKHPVLGFSSEISLSYSPVIKHYKSTI